MTALPVRDVAEARPDITDELLVAYLDGELDAAQHATVGAALEGDPDLRRRVEEMRLSSDLLREAFPQCSPASKSLHIEAAAERLAAAAGMQNAGLTERDFRFRPIYAVAAALALCAVVAAAYIARQPAKPESPKVTALAQMDPGNPLHDLLESTPSAQVVEVPAKGGSLRAILTFRARDGRFCREFEIFAKAGSSTGVACREEGRWRSELMLSGNAAPPSNGHYIPASGSEDPAIAALVDGLIQGEPLGIEEEAQVLAANWPSRWP